jgi:hypothetical protein
VDARERQADNGEHADRLDHVADVTGDAMTMPASSFRSVASIEAAIGGM